MDLAELRATALFDGLDDDQLAELMSAGSELPFEPDEVLFRERRPADFWWVLLEGTITLVRQVGTEETVMGALTSPGQWAGGFRAWDEHGIYFATGRAGSPGRAFRLPSVALRQRADAWFPFGVHFIEGLVNTVRRIESTARQREALVALGTLAAGLAHEINNPAASAIRAVDALEEASTSLLSALGAMAAAPISAQQFTALDALRRELRHSSTALDPLAAADREEALSDWLSDHGVARDWLITPSLAGAGVDVDWCERVAAALGDGPLEAGLEWVANSLAMAALISEVKDSTRRISALVAAVRSYSQLDRAAVQPTAVQEGIESTLVMLGHKTKDGVTVVRDYAPDVPMIEAIPGELNQVWTNVIDNAIDAMDGTGTLRVSTRVDALGSVVVEIADTGHGLSEEVLAHAFEPFYTTKEVGRGTGLGLEISRRIVAERHLGEISIRSQPGDTVVSVRLPPRGASKG